MIAHDFNIDSNDVFSFLRLLGKDCAGALIIIPEDEHPQPQGKLQHVNDLEIEQRLDKLHLEPLGIDEKQRLSLAGVQGKLLLTKKDNQWALPISGVPSTHILKPEHHRFKDMVINEALCMRVGKHLQLNIAEVEIIKFGSITTLVIERYDRVNEKSKIKRIHQEDFTQASALDSKRKYEENDGPSFKNCAEILNDWSSNPAMQLERLFEHCFLLMLVGNADAHAKNISLMHCDNGSITLAPIYDQVATVYYNEVSTVPGMFINQKKDINHLHKNDLLVEAQRWGMSEKQATAIFDKLLQRTPHAIAQAAQELSPPQDLVNLINQRYRIISA